MAGASTEVYVCGTVHDSNSLAAHDLFLGLAWSDDAIIVLSVHKQSFEATSDSWRLMYMSGVCRRAVHAVCAASRQLC